MNQEVLQNIIEGCRQQNKNSQKELFYHYYDYGMRIASRYGKSNQETEEIANDGFFKALHHIDQYKGNIPFKLWLRKIIINSGIDHYRRFHQNKQKIHPKNEVLLNAADQRLDAEYLLQMIRALSPQYRMVFVLHVIEGFSHEDIAQQLNISKGTSKSNLSKARKKLKEMLESHELQTIDYETP